MVKSCLGCSSSVEFTHFHVFVAALQVFDASFFLSLLLNCF